MRTRIDVLATATLLGAGLCMGLGAARAQTGGPLPGAAQYKPTPEHPVGWRGDGTGRFPGATPPTGWERRRVGPGYATRGIVWATPLPAGGISSPIIVGNRIFVTSEVSDLVRLDKQTGKILWIRSHPEFEGLTDAERQADPAFAQKLAPLAQQLAAVNAQVVAVLNALHPRAAALPYVVLPPVTMKRAIEKQIQEQLNTISKKKFDHSWPQGVYGYCTETPTSDGKHVCAYISTGISVCYDLQGNRKWIARGPCGGEEKGHFTSPLILGNQLVVWGGPQMRAYDVETGKVLWTNTVEAANASSMYGLRVGNEAVAAFRNYFVRVSDGKAIWGSGNVNNATVTPIVEGNTIYAWMTGNPAALKALEVPADTDSGKPTPKLTFQIDWEANELPESKQRPFDRGIIASPLLVDGLIYQISSGGGLQVHDAATGETVYRKLLPMKPRTEYWAWGGACCSPALAGKYIYLIDNQGTTVIIAPGRQYKEVAVNHIEESLDGKSQDQNLACPAFEGGRMYYRTPGYLYCIGQR